MSHAARCLESAVRSLASTNARNASSVRTMIPGVRRYAHAQVALQSEQKQAVPAHSSGSSSDESVTRRRPEPEPRDVSAGETRSQRSSSLSSSTPTPFRSTSGAVHELAEVDESGWSPDPTQRRPTDRRREEYFSRLFSPLKFPTELARRTLTHNSHLAARQGHNAALAFMGRRVMSAYFMMFLHSSRKLQTADDVEDITARSLNTHLLGEYIGNEWGVGRELVWAPSISLGLKTDGHLPGLYKVQGETVQAILGAIYRQYGGVVAHRVFHTRVLPLLLVRGGLPAKFHPEVLKVCERLGGREGPLLLESTEEQKLAETAA